MRIVSIITAIIVVIGLYFLVFERDALRQVSDGAPVETLVEAATAKDDPSQIKAAPVAAKDENVTEKTPIKVIALKSLAREIDTAVVLRGQTKAARSVDVRAETSGQVTSNPIRKGALVTEGDLMCELDAGTRMANLADTQARLVEAKARVPETEARLDEAKSRLEEATINFTAAEKLAKDGYATETRLASTQATVRAAEAGVATARAGFEATSARIQSAEAAVAASAKEIDRLVMRAPFSGLLESDTAEIGSLLQPGALCGTVIQLDPIKIVGFVSESELPRVELGAPARAALISGQNITGEVTFISRSADQLTRTFTVEIAVPNPDLTISDGQTAEIEIGARGSKAHLLPQSALTLNDQGALGIRAIEADNSALFHEVTLIRDTAQGVWLAGLPEELNVIVVGQEYVNDGILVDPTYREMSQ